MLKLFLDWSIIRCVLFISFLAIVAFKWNLDIFRVFLVLFFKIFQTWKKHKFWLAKPNGLAIQKVWY